MDDGVSKVIFIFVYSLSVFLYYVFDGVIFSVSTRIWQPKTRSIFKWSMLCLNRFLACIFPFTLSLILLNLNSVDLILIGVKIVLMANIANFALFSLLPRILMYFWRKYREDSKTGQEEKWIWYDHALIADYQLQKLTYTYVCCFISHHLICLIKRRWMNSSETKIAIVNILGNDRIYDPAWPRCSIGHTIAVIGSPECIHLLVLRTSFFRRQTRILWSYPLPEFDHESLDQLKMRAFENGGLILIFAVYGINHRLWIIDLGNGNTISVDLEPLFPTPFFTILFALRNDGSELGDGRNTSSMYVRLIYNYRNPGVSICYGQSLIEVPLIENGGFARTVLRNEFYWPASWKFDALRLFQTSCGQMEMKIRLRNPVFGQRIDIGTLFWDPSHKKLVWGDYDDLVREDRPLRLFMERYPDIDQLYSIVPRVLNDGEAMVVQKDWSVWRTSFQPPSFKSLCLEKVFGTYKKQLEKFNGEKWMEMTGVDVSAYFQGKK